MKRLKGVRRRKGDLSSRRKASCRAATNPGLIPRLPPSAKITWRVIAPGARLGGFDQVHKETTVEREALRCFRDLRHEGYPVLVSRWQIYRVRIEPRCPFDPERFAFVESYSKDDACARIAVASTGFDRCTLSEARSRVSAKSYEECRHDGVSADLELRLFEIGWSNGRATAWVREPMFFLPEPSALTRKWSQLLERLVH
jgi:hypothetical protein